jgi:predicted RNA binding protein YcfA (HicA-like mRNA interferase family)
MSPLLPQVKAKDLMRVAEKLGFKFDRQSGSHAVYYRESDKRRVVIPIHYGKDIKPKTLSSIIKDMGLEPDEFKELL